MLFFYVMKQSILLSLCRSLIPHYSNLDLINYVYVSFLLWESFTLNQLVLFCYWGILCRLDQIFDRFCALTYLNVFLIYFISDI